MKDYGRTDWPDTDLNGNPWPTKAVHMKPLFTLNAGICEMDEPKVRVLAKQRPADGAISIFYASVICQLFDLMTGGKLKGVSPDRVRIVITDG